jgi:hypothetical protein
MALASGFLLPIGGAIYWINRKKKIRDSFYK